MVEIRFITCGDLHIYSGSSNIAKLQNVVKFANDAFSKGKLDFITFVGDIADTVSDGTSKSQQAANIISGLNSNLTRYLVAGNHDVIGSQCIQTCSSTGSIVDKSCVFKTVYNLYPEQYYTFQKEGKTFNIIIPGVCAANWSVNPTWYFNYNNLSINKSLPTLVFNHGPVLSRSGWDSFDLYAQGMNTYLNQFTSLVGVYAGHVHQETNQMSGNTRHVTNNAIGSTSNVGYTRVRDDNTTDYTTLNYTQSFTDPFPDTPPTTKYRCSGAPNYLCTEDPTGTYNSLQECQSACKETPPPPPTQECSTNNCTLKINNYRLDNNKWGAPNATQSIFITSPTGPVGFAWNNSQRGYNYPEIILGKNRNCGSNTWPSGPFPLTHNNIQSCSTEITYKFTQKPTVNSWWNFAFDLYWMNGTSSCDQGKVYNIMVWIHGLPKFAGNLVKDNISDGNNTWSYYSQQKAWPWYGLLLKNRDKIPYEPVLNQQYTIRIDLKKLFDAVGGLNDGWYFPGIEFGAENAGTVGATSGKVEISQFDIEINGQKTGLGQTPPPPTKYRCTGSPDYQCVVDPTGPYNSLTECQTACKAPPPTTKYSFKPTCKVVEDPNGKYNTIEEAKAAAESNGYIVI